MDLIPLFTKLFNIMRAPSHLRLFFHDVLRLKHKIDSDSRHLREAIGWLCRAQDATMSGGVSEGYFSPYGGWQPAYPETTGYIIPTLLKYGLKTENESLIQRSIRMGDWEIDVRLSSGAVCAGSVGNKSPRIFNTGQVILGWTALARHTGEMRFVEAAEKAALWLIKNQDPDGKWSRYCHNNCPHAYHARVAWPILEVYAMTENIKMLESAKRLLEWVLSQAQENGWCSHMAFTPEAEPLTHTIAYTIRGLLECAAYFQNDELFFQGIMKIVRNSSENLIAAYKRQKGKSKRNRAFLPATFNARWESNESYSCVTGNAQLAIIWLKLYAHSKQEHLLHTANEMLETLKSIQDLKSKNPGIRGALPGSFPCWGKYNPFSFPNWSTKFFADALMLRRAIGIS